MKPAEILALLLTAAACIVTVCMLLAPFAASFDLFRQLWPFWMLLAFAAAAVSALVAHWRLLLPAIGLILLQLSLPVETRPAGTARAASSDLRLVTLNLWARNKQVDRAVSVLQSIDADIIALQEAYPAQMPGLQRLTDSHPYQARCASWSVRLFSRLPILDSGCLLPTVPPDPALGHPPRGLDLPTAVWARIALPDGSHADILSVHMTWPEPVNNQNVERVMLGQELYRFDHDRLILLGDFNAAPPSQALVDMAEEWQLERRTSGLPTWPAPFPLVAIDHVFAGEAWQTLNVERGAQTGSDHRPVIIDLDLRN